MARALAALALFLLPVLQLSAQGDLAQSAQTEEEKPIVRRLIINFTGLSNVNEEVARANMSMREGEPYNSVAVDRDIGGSGWPPVRKDYLAAVLDVAAVWPAAA